jgi:hypothetical protein
VLLGALLAIAPTIAATGCGPAGPGVNMFKDDSIPRSEWTTPSAEAVAARHPTPEIRERPWPAAEALYEPIGVPHWPLWWADPFEDKGSSFKDQFAWTYEDYVALGYSNGRWLLNTMLWPASAVVRPAWTTMISDGYVSKQLIGYDHDSTPGKPWPVTVGPLDFEPTTQPAQ